MTSRRQYQASQLLGLVGECLEDREFDWKRSVFRLLHSMKTDRGEKIKEISNRRRQRGIKLIPFFICSCQRSLELRKAEALSSAWKALRSVTAIADAGCQTGYQIKMSAGINHSSMADVTTNLQRKFDNLRVEQAALSRRGLKPLKQKQERDRSVSVLDEKSIHKTTATRTPRLTPTRRLEASTSPTPSAAGVKKVDSHHAQRLSKKTIDELIAEKKQQIFKLKMRERGREYYKHQDDDNLPRPDKTKHQQSSGYGANQSHSIHSAELESRDLLKSSALSFRGIDGRPVAKEYMLGLKTLTLLTNIKTKHHKRRFMDNFKKLNAERIRKVISVYKRRNFMQLEKTLALVRVSLARQAFASVKQRKHTVVPREVSMVRAGLLALATVKMVEHVNLRYALKAVRLAQRDRPTPATSRQGRGRLAESELHFRDIQVCYYESEPRSLNLKRVLQAVSENIKGHKRTKRSMLVSLALGRVFTHKTSAFQQAFFEYLTAKKHRFDVLEGQFNMLRRTTEAKSTLYLKLGFQKTADHANMVKVKRIHSLADILKAIFKKKSLQPTFHYVKFDYPRIVKKNLKLMTDFLMQMAKLASNREHLLKVKALKCMKTCRRSVSRVRMPSQIAESSRNVKTKFLGSGAQITTSSVGAKSLENKCPNLDDCKGQPAKHNPRRKSREVSPVEAGLTKGPPKAKDEPAEQKRSTRTIAALKKQETSRISAQLEKEACRMNRLINAITQKPKAAPPAKAKKAQTVVEKQITSMLVCEETADFTGTQAPRGERTPEDYQLINEIFQGMAKGGLPEFKDSNLEAQTEAEEIMQTATDDNEEEQVLGVERQTCIPEQFTVHDLKGTLNDRCIFQEVMVNVQAFMTSKLNSELVAPSDYFSFQKYEHKVIELPVAVEDFRPDSHRSGRAVEKPAVNNKENIPLLVNSIPKLFDGFSLVGKSDLVPKIKTEGLARPSMESSAFRSKSNLTDKGTSSEASQAKSKLPRYDQESSDQDEESECDVLNYLTIVRAPEEKASL